MMIAIGAHKQEELAGALGVRSATLSPYKKTNRVPYSWIQTLREKYGISPDYLLSGEGSVKVPADLEGATAPLAIKVPLVSSRHSRKGGFHPLPESENWIRFEAVWLADQAKDISRLLLLKYSGLHMTPEIQEGDLVLFNQERTDLDSGKLYAVRIEEAITVHRILLGVGVLTLRSENHDYPDQTIKRELLGSPQFEVLGKVLGIFRTYY